MSAIESLSSIELFPESHNYVANCIEKYQVTAFNAASSYNILATDDWLLSNFPLERATSEEVDDEDFIEANSSKLYGLQGMVTKVTLGLCLQDPMYKELSLFIALDLTALQLPYVLNRDKVYDVKYKDIIRIQINDQGNHGFLRFALGSFDNAGLATHGMVKSVMKTLENSYLSCYVEK